MEKKEVLYRDELEKDIEKIKEDILWAKETENASVLTWLMECLESKEKILDTLPTRPH